MSRVPSLAPFRVRDGRLVLEGVELAELAEGLQGRAAFVLGHRALSSAIAHALRAAGGPLTVAVGDVGPREVLALLAAAGCSARAGSAHELQLARAAGFPLERLVVGAPVLEDGLLRDALAAGVTVIEAEGEVARNLGRIAAALDHATPAATGAPPPLPEATFARAGGLLAPLLSGLPALTLDAAWEPRGRGRVVMAALAGPAAAPVEASVRGLRGLAAPALMSGAAARSEWVVLPDRRAAQVHRPDPAHPLPLVVMVREGAWRILDPRPWPADAEPRG